MTQRSIILSATPHLDRIGYYEVNGQKQLHKPTAYFMAGENWQNVKFNFNDQVFSSYDWTKEPEPQVPLTEFYRRRAQQLRDKYEYLVLMYSGGPDSQNMLNAFIDNNILVDEIVNINSYERTRIHEGTIHNADWIHNAKPWLDHWFKECGLKARLTVIDEIDLSKNYMQTLMRRGDYELAFGTTGWVSHIIFKGIWIKYVPHLWSMMLDGKKIGVIVGSEKPRIEIDAHDRYFTRWFDLTLPDVHLALSEDADLKDVEFSEFFYHSPENIDLIAKQLHVLKNFMEHHTQDEFYGDDVNKIVKRRLHTCVSKHNKKHLTYAAFHKIIYPKWNPAIITPKTSALVDRRSQDNWWINKFTQEEMKFWYMCFSKIMPFKDQPTLLSKPIYLE